MLDNIIFSLQKAGGVSAVWYENIKRLVDNKEFNLRFLEYDNAKENFFRKQLSIDNESVKIQNSKLLFLKRYLNLYSQSTKSVTSAYK